MIAFLSHLWSKARNWVLGILGFLAIVTGAFTVGRLRGKKAQQSTEALGNSLAQVAQDKAQSHDIEARHEVENQTAGLPDAPAQSVGTADPSTAAGRLRDEGWTRGAGSD